MRFLCLHGAGTNSQVFETQTAAIRYELEGRHTFDFVEGSLASSIAPEIKNYYPLTDSYYRYYEQLSAPSMRAALYQLSKYIETEGPFDGVIGYSQGASLAATYLIQCSKLRSSERMPFKCAIFFSGGIPLDPMALESGDLKLITPKKTGALLTLPTTHIWGSNDEIWPGSSEILYEACEESQRNVSVHTEGHDIPGTRAKEAVQDAVRAIRRTLDRLPAGWGQ